MLNTNKNLVITLTHVKHEKFLQITLLNPKNVMEIRFKSFI